jgi:ABC-type multidrug transport system fused ATPase/permease subunit
MVQTNIFLKCLFKSIMKQHLEKQSTMILTPNQPSTLKKFLLNLLAILKNEIGWFDEANHASSMLSAQLETDATLLRTIVVDRATILLQNVGMIATSLVIAFILNWRITLVVLATYPLMVSGHISEVLPLLLLLI